MASLLNQKSKHYNSQTAYLTGNVLWWNDAAMEAYSLLTRGFEGELAEAWEQGTLLLLACTAILLCGRNVENDVEG